MNDTNSTRPLRAFTCLLVALLGLWLGLPQRVFAVTQEEVVPGEVVVGLRPESDSLGIAQRLSDFGASTSHLHAIHAYRLRLRPGLSIDTALAQLRQRPEVLYAEPNHILHIFATPNDYYYGQQYGPQKVQANLAWGLWNPQTTVVIAIVDTGIDNTHPDLTNKIYRDVNGIVGYNGFTELRSNALDDNGHGTHCAGIAAAQINNGVGVAGIAGWNGQANSSDADHIKLMPVKVMDNTGSGTDISVANGIIWAADHGAKVISMSLGSDTSSDTMANAVQYAWSKGCVIAAAAGNSGSSAFSYPGAYPNVISVAATDNTDTLASFSNYGSWVSVAAPGVNIVSTTPTYSTGWPLNYASASGTSMATPHVAGEAALLLAQNPNLTNSQVYNLIIGNVDPYVPNGTHTLATGRGRINVYRALLAATPATTAPNVPANLAAATGSGQVYLAWNPSTGATGYNVKRATTSGGPYTTIASNVASPSYLNTGLTNGTTYYYVVSAVNSIGESANSAQVRATPVNVVRVNSGGGQYISFNSGIWSGDSYYSGGSTYSVGTRTIANTSDPTLYLSERYSGTSFSYTLPASNGSYTLNLHFAEVYYTSAGQRLFNVSINGAPSLTNFDILATAGGANKALIESFPVTVSNGQVTISFQNVKGGAKVSAIELVPSLANGTPPPPAAPTGLMARAGLGQISLSWNPSTGATGYNVKRATTSGGPYTTIASNVASTSYINTGLTAGTTYYYVVSAVNSNGEGPDSSQTSATTWAAIRVNAGGGAYTSSTSGSWSGDSYYSGGSTYSVGTRTIANTSDPTLYLSERYSGTSFSYTLPASNGSYTLNLHFAEVYYTSAGQRLFNVSINGAPSLTNFDILATAGGANKALIESFPVTVSNGQVTISFQNVKGGAKVSAIELKPAG